MKDHATRHYAARLITAVPLVMTLQNGPAACCQPASGTMVCQFNELVPRGRKIAEKKGWKGGVSRVEIVSEKGKDCVVVKPWPGRKVTLVRTGGERGSSAVTKQDKRFSFRTAVNENIELRTGELGA